MPINEDKLCILKKNAINNQVSIAYEPIEIELKDELEELYELLNDQSILGETVFNFIKNHRLLKVLLNKYNFCTYPTGTYEGIYDDLERIETQFINPNYRKTTLLAICKRRALANSLEKAYKKCDRDDTILAFSHRRVGWSEKPYQIDENFSIEFKTNFGYGNSSYFYTKLSCPELGLQF